MTGPHEAADPAARRAALMLVLSSSLFALMALLAKIVSHEVPTVEAAAVRFATGGAVVLVLRATGRIELRPRRWGWLFARGLFGGTAVVFYFSGMQRISVGEATLLNYTQPVFTMLAAWMLLGERPPRRALVALPVTLLGVALIVGIRLTDLHAELGQMFALTSAVLSGVAVTSIRAARREIPGGTPAETAWTVFTAFTLLGLVVTVPLVLPPLGRWVAPSPRAWALLLGVGLSSVAAQVLMTWALRHLRVGTAGVITQLTAVGAIGAGAIFLGERLSPGFLTGAVITLSGVAFAIFGSAPGRLAPRLLGKLRARL
ncbi:MAG TPA: DMT family transporter [Polyangia bacterium]|nr:DMT family transporter [Polyangia bacterium]